MADVPTLGRDGTSGKFLPGNNHAKGRPALPQWFKDGAEDCLRVLLACATGATRPGDPPAATDVATNASPKERIAAAELICNRVLGKAPETITIDGGSPVLDLLVAMAKPVEPK